MEGVETDMRGEMRNEKNLTETSRKGEGCLRKALRLFKFPGTHVELG